eukprot:1160154-Pelagomonas_calceolata.AAC.9
MWSHPSGFLRSPDSWFDKKPGQTLYSSLKGVDVAFSRSYLSNITMAPNVLFPTKSGMWVLDDKHLSPILFCMAGVQIPTTAFSEWCSTEDDAEYCKQESTLETMMTYTRNSTFYKDMDPELRDSQATKFVSGEQSFTT